MILSQTSTDGSSVFFISEFIVPGISWSGASSSLEKHSKEKQQYLHI
jgi:hypothetical protein